MNDEEKVIERIVEMLQWWPTAEDRITILVEIIYAIGVFSDEPIDPICLVHAFVKKVHTSFHTERKMDTLLKKVLGPVAIPSKKKPKKGN